MPTYEYTCESCGHRFEKFEPMSARRKKICRKCKGELTRKIGPGGAVIFKGSGFYETDYKRKVHGPRTGRFTVGEGEAKGGDRK